MFWGDERWLKLQNILFKMFAQQKYIIETEFKTQE